MNTGAETLSPNTGVVIDLATELELAAPDLAKGILVGALLGKGLTGVDRAALGAALVSIQMKQDKQTAEIRKGVSDILNLSSDEMIQITHYLRQARIIDDKGNLI